jgi:hypothetical protein
MLICPHVPWLRPMAFRARAWVNNRYIETYIVNDEA